MYYVYTLSRPDGRVFYVGKGKGTRMWQHESEAHAGHRCHKCSTIRKIWREGGKVVKRKIFETPDESTAYTAEILCIALCGRSNLSNLTDGGDGMRNPSPATRAKCRQARLGKTHTLEARAAISRAARRRVPAVWTPEQRARQSSIMKGRHPPAPYAAKTYTGFVSPSGVMYRDIFNLSDFCRQHGLCRVPMTLLSQGKRNQYKGWKRLEV